MKTLLFTLLVSLSTFGFGQSKLLKEGSFVNHVSSDVYHAGKSVLYVYQRPFSWKKKEWLLFGGVIGTAFAVPLVDEDINAYFKRNQTQFQDELASVGDFLGQPEYQGPALLAFYTLGVSINNEWIRETGSMLAASMTASGLIQIFSKDAVGRSRPSMGEGNTNFKPFG